MIYVIKKPGSMIPYYFGTDKLLVEKRLEEFRKLSNDFFIFQYKDYNEFVYYNDRV